MISKCASADCTDLFDYREAIKADHRNGVLTLNIPKREEVKPKQTKVNVGTPATAAAGAR